MSTTANVPDVCRLDAETLPAADFPANRQQDFRVFFNPGVHAQIWKHASEDLSVEICGVLVGLWQRDDAGPYATVSEFIRCDSAKSGFAEVTFTHESWTKINAQMDSQFAKLKIIGWYHSHPNFGIFLSDRDVFIHQHFFSGPGQIAHVVDPVRKIEGVFAWREGKPVLSPHYWVGDRICVTEEKPLEASAHPGDGAAPAARRIAAGSERSSSLMTSLTTLALMACLFLLGLLLSGKLTDWERRRESERDLLGVIAYFADHKLLRPELDGNLNALGTTLHAVAAETKKLADAYSKREGKEDEALREVWERLGKELADADQKLNHIRSQDLLTPAEEQLVKEAGKELVRIIQERDTRRADAARRAISAGDTEQHDTVQQKDERRRPPQRDDEQKNEISSTGESGPKSAANKPKAAATKLKSAPDKTLPSKEDKNK